MNIKKSIYKYYNRFISGEYKRLVNQDAVNQWNLSDVYLTSYPKSGNSWVNMLLANILNEVRGYSLRVDYFTMHEIIPDIYVNPRRIIQIDPPRIIKTHEPFNAWNKRISIIGKEFRFPRAIYIVRDGRDVMVSYYYERTAIYGDQGSITDFIKNTDKKIGSWADHIRGWLINNNTLDPRNILIIKFEEVRSDTFSILQKILDFIGLEVDNNIIKRAIEKSDIKRMREIESKYGAPEKYADSTFSFARKGKSGDIEDRFKTIMNQFYENNSEVFEFLKYPRLD